MRNKQRNERKVVSCPNKEEQETTVVMSGSSCSGETAGRHGTYSAAAPPVKRVRPQQHTETVCPNDNETSPAAGNLGPTAGTCPRFVISEQGPAAYSPFTHTCRCCRRQLAASALRGCLEEIQRSNPLFPAYEVFSCLQKKVNLQDSVNAQLSLNTGSPENCLKERSGGSERPTKRLRSAPVTESAGTHNHQEHCVLTAKKQPRSHKLSRTQRQRLVNNREKVVTSQAGPVSNREQVVTSQAGLVSNREQVVTSQAGPVSNREQFSMLSNPEYYNHSPETSESFQAYEDVLWTDKFSPRQSSEVIGNSASVNKLHSWLKRWKQRSVSERRRMEEIKEENSHDVWDCGDFQGEVGAEDNREEPLCNTMLITGPPGVGKTAAVYACCQELGFKVFEVNCSSKRSGRHVLTQLKEATQSHLVEVKDPLKPAYFSNYSSAAKSLAGKNLHPKNVTSASKRRAARSCSTLKRRPDPTKVTLANYFKMTAKADYFPFSGPSPSENRDRLSPSSDPAVPHNKTTTMSLILFEEVDVVFDDDVGFLAAIKTFMRTTKRPVVLTSNDPTFRQRFSCSLEEVIFKVPAAGNVCSYLQLVALAQNMRLELDDVCNLLTLTGSDIRRCLLQLQFWACSIEGSQGGGLRQKLTGLQLESRMWPIDTFSAGADFRAAENASLNPQCDTGCTVSMLGLAGVTCAQLIDLLQCCLWSEDGVIKLLQLLSESWRHGVPLLYSNLELLLPNRTSRTLVLYQAEGGYCRLQNVPPDLHIKGLNGVTSSKSLAVSRISRLSRRRYISETDTSSSSSVKQSPQTSINTEHNIARASSACLNAWTDFFDLMSYLDATVPAAAPLISGPCKPGEFTWTGAEVYDGVLDEFSEVEDGRNWSREGLLDISSAVEGLGCHMLMGRVSAVWSEVQQYRQELGDQRWRRVESLLVPVTSNRQNLTFTFQPLCAPSVSQRRFELSRTVLSRSSFSLLGDRNAVSVDYMPVLRHMCRLQRTRRQKEEPHRCLNYLSGKHLGLSKSTVQLLAEDFS